jgi:aminoglycoside phosphotransferase (APT) family kinase protein
MELAEIQEVRDRLARTVPALTGAGQAVLQRLGELAGELPPDPVVPAHHDFRPAQVLLSGEQVGFIDFDGAAMAEPALDLGRFRAKLRDIGISAFGAQGTVIPRTGLADHLRLQDQLGDHFLQSYRAHAPVSPARVELWEACDLFTTMLHAWTKVRTARLAPRLKVLRHHVRRAAR